MRRSSGVSGLRLGGLVFVVGMLAACTGGGTREAVPPPPTPSAKAGDATAPSPTATRPAPARPMEQPAFVPSPGARDLRTLLASPGSPLPALQRTVRPLPAASFGPWNHLDIVLYDIDRRRETNRGPGHFPGFTPDGRYLYWITGGPVGGGDSNLAVLEIETASVRTLGEALGVRSGREAGYLQVQVNGGRFERVSLLDGSRTPGASDLGPSHQTPTLAAHAGWRLDSLLADGWTYGFGQYRLSDETGEQPPIEFEAWQVALLPDGRLIVATSPTELQSQGGRIPGRTAATDIYEVNPVTGGAMLIAQARASESLFAFAANERYIAWTEDFCNISNLESPDSNGRTRIYDTQSGTLTELDQAFYIAGLTPRGELAIGAFGADALLDVETLEYTVVFPSDDRVWSPDYRYAAVGATGGHGGYCGGG